MKTDKLVQLSLDLLDGGEPEAALMLACVAVDGTAKKAYGDPVGAPLRFANVIRNGASVFGPMAAPGINITDSRLAVKTSTVTAEPVPGLPVLLPDVADVLYAVHRSAHGHGEELPQGFELRPDGGGFPLTRLEANPGKACFSHSTISALLALAVLHPVHRKGARVPSAYHLDFQADQYVINDWWGRYDEFYDDVIAPAGTSSDQTFLPPADWIEAVFGPAPRAG